MKPFSQTKNLENYFQPFRKNVIGHNQEFITPYGKKKLYYFDWTASGELYAPIEDAIKNIFGPFVGNTHSESTETGTDMTLAYHKAFEIIKRHVHAGPDDMLIFTGTGMTGAITKLQRILGLKFSDQLHRYEAFTNLKSHSKPFSEEEKPVVFITHMEHHSNQTSWIEADVDVVVIPQGKNGLVDPDKLRGLVEKYKARKIKIGSFSACSNVTGIFTPYHVLAKIMHEYGGLCFVDFAACAPYINMAMHTKDPAESLDAIFFSPHKFLGGPGTSGVLLFNKKLYLADAPPENPGGGTVAWTNPWGGRNYYENIEIREDGGTPGFLQAIRTALCIQLKDKMGVENILSREEQLLTKLQDQLKAIPDIHILGDYSQPRLGIVSFYSETIHYNLIVKLLNDRFGIQTRGGCSCAGTYGHCLFDIDQHESKIITDRIDSGDLSTKPGWVRISLHPTVLDKEVAYLGEALQAITLHIDEWKKDYIYNSVTNEFHHKNSNKTDEKEKIAQWFTDAII
ncbi:MAG: aminotransferase class V-fold PLP-dependent enzyme [Candidatus Levyibacteriota bacterium]